MKFLSARNVYCPICLSFLVLLMFSYPGLGQPSPNSMRVSGVVTDANGAVVAGAKVTLRDPATNKQISVMTNAEGFYRFSNVSAGKYEITVEAAGFANGVINGVEVKASQNKTVDIKMPVRQAATGTGTPPGQERVGNIGGHVVLSTPSRWQTDNHQQRVGNIGGMDRQNTDGTHDLLADFKSDVPIDTVKLLIRGPLGEEIVVAHAPPGWVSNYDQKTGYLTLNRGPGGLPLFEIQARYRLPKSWEKELKEFLTTPKQFEFSLGPFNYGPRDFQVTLAPPTKVVTPDQAIEDIPKFVRPGDSFSITPLEVYRSGIWQLGIGDKVYEEYPDEPPLFDLSRIAKYLPDRDKAQEEMDRQLQQRQPVLSQLPLSGRLFHIPKDARLPPGGKVNLTYTNEYGETTVSGPVHVNVLPSLTLDPALVAPRLFACTPKIFQGDKLCVCGYFPNSFSRRQLLLDGKRLDHPRSGSTDTLVFVPQNLAPGKHVITWDVPAFDSFYNPEPGRVKPSATERVEFIVLEAKGTIDQDKLRSGQRTEMHLKILGTDEKLPIELTNNTPDVIELQGGIKQVINTKGGSDNTLTRWVKAEKTGKPIANFDIQYRLTVPPCPCQPERLSEFLPLAGVLSKTPEKPPGDQPSDIRQDCDLIMLEYNRLSIEYGKRKSDRRRYLEGCDRLDDGTRQGRISMDDCKRAVVFDKSLSDDFLDLRLKLLDLLSRYRACREAKPAANQ